jgi:diguanylate cyclase (GGDEF)-like protein/PAS domain S-box-containing protein
VNGLTSCAVTRTLSVLGAAEWSLGPGNAGRDGWSLVSSSDAAQKERVLLVDDEPQVLVALEDLLSDQFMVMKTDSAESALRLVETENDIAVIITDQRMPRMSGDELLTKLERCSSATRILLTGFADLSAVIRAVNSGHIFAYVSKPWQADDLRLKVQKAADHFRLAKELAQERRLLEDLMENVPDAIYFKDAELKFLRANRPVAELVGGTPEELVGKTLAELKTPDSLLEEAEERRIMHEGKPVVDVLRSYQRAGGERWFSETKVPIRSPDGHVIGLVGISRDVTLRRQQEAAVARLTKVRAVMSGINVAIVRTSEREALIQETLRITVETGELALAAVFEVRVENEAVHLVAVEPQGTDFMREMEARLKDNSLLNSPSFSRVLSTERPVVINDVAASLDLVNREAMLRHGFRSVAAFPLIESGVAVGVFCLFAHQAGFFDSEEVKLLTELADNLSFALDHIGKSQRLDYLAYHDELTGLPNRELLLDLANQRLTASRRDGTGLAALLIDVGRFRQINETLGRRGGDELLVQVSRRLLRIAGSDGTLARFDSNSFALLVAGIENEAAVNALVEEEILGALKDSFLIGGTELRISVRIGAALFPTDGGEPEILIANAEAALRKTKASGQPYLSYKPFMNAHVAEQMSLETRLRRAVEAREFVLHYQPKVDLKLGTVVGLEALIRWQEPGGKLVPPGHFIPVLEETGLIGEVGRWVLERAALQYHDWSKAGLSPPRIAVNVSALQLAGREFVSKLERVLQCYPAGESGIDLEITESVFVDDLEGSIEKLAIARAKGLGVAIDDFGTGYSSLSYLGRLPIDALKIDRSFVTGMADDPQSTSIVTTIISLAHSLDLKVIAEGVETEGQAQLLRLLKCDQAQGYLISRPVPPEEAAKLLSVRFDVGERRR